MRASVRPSRHISNTVLRILHWNDVYILDNFPRMATALKAYRLGGGPSNSPFEAAAIASLSSPSFPPELEANKETARTVIALAGDFLAPNVLTPIVRQPFTCSLSLFTLLC